MERLIKEYFKFFSNKDISSLEKLFAEDVKLVDWETYAKGKDEVIKANKKIFDQVDTLQIEVNNLYINGQTVICLIDILINKSEKLKVIDLIRFNNDNKITLISAYKQ
tara:strand:+ start:309 stop:632 length:324 start_codon:yes stop_codon:yes gene_type:complete